MCRLAASKVRGTPLISLPSILSASWQGAGRLLADWQRINTGTDVRTAAQVAALPSSLTGRARPPPITGRRPPAGRLAAHQRRADARAAQDGAGRPRGHAEDGSPAGWTAGPCGAARVAGAPGGGAGAFACVGALGGLLVLPLGASLCGCSGRCVCLSGGRAVAAGCCLGGAGRQGRP